MIGEDYRTRAHHNYLIIKDLESQIVGHKKHSSDLEETIKLRNDEISRRITEKENLIMSQEDTAGSYFNLLDKKNEWERLTHLEKTENKNLMKRFEILKAEK